MYHLSQTWEPMRPLTTGTSSSEAARAVSLSCSTANATFCSGLIPGAHASVLESSGPMESWPANPLPSAEMTRPLSATSFFSFRAPPFRTSCRSRCVLKGPAGSSTAW